MKIGIVSGSHRKESQSKKVSNFVIDRLKELSISSDTYYLDLGNNPLPLWDESKWQAGGAVNEAFKPVSAELHSCEAFVIVTPEWSGMVPSALKNFFLLCESGELAHKPAMIVAISSSMGGSYPVAELRMSSYKNTQITYIPDHIIIRTVEGLLVNVSEENQKTDAYIKTRIDYSLKILAEYGRALKSVREAGIIDRKTYPFGM